jgi:hypothetical protein
MSDDDSNPLNRTAWAFYKTMLASIAKVFTAMAVFRGGQTAIYISQEPVRKQDVAKLPKSASNIFGLD